MVRVWVRQALRSRRDVKGSTLWMPEPRSDGAMTGQTVRPSVLPRLCGLQRHSACFLPSVTDAAGKFTSCFQQKTTPQVLRCPQPLVSQIELHHRRYNRSHRTRSRLNAAVTKIYWHRECTRHGSRIGAAATTTVCPIIYDGIAYSDLASVFASLRHPLAIPVLHQNGETPLDGLH